MRELISSPENKCITIVEKVEWKKKKNAENSSKMHENTGRNRHKSRAKHIENLRTEFSTNNSMFHVESRYA